MIFTVLTPQGIFLLLDFNKLPIILRDRSFVLIFTTPHIWIHIGVVAVSMCTSACGNAVVVYCAASVALVSADPPGSGFIVVLVHADAPRTRLGHAVTLRQTCGYRYCYLLCRKLMDETVYHQL